MVLSPIAPMAVTANPQADPESKPLTPRPLLVVDAMSEGSVVICEGSVVRRAWSGLMREGSCTRREDSFVMREGNGVMREEDVVVVEGPHPHPSSKGKGL